MSNFSGPPLQQVSRRLGLTDRTLLIKAAEFERLLKLKLSHANKISDTAQIVICLDLAAERLCIEFDSETAVKLAAVKRSVYTNYKQTIEKLLHLTDSVDVNGLCVQFGCPSVRELATDVLKLIQETRTQVGDLNNPQFVCMAVYQACKIDKIKNSKQKLLLRSRMKLAQWNEMDAKWSKIISTSPLSVKRNRKENLVKQNRKENLEPESKSLENKPCPTNVLQSCETLEDFEAWKREVLKQACEELGDPSMCYESKNNTSDKSGVKLIFPFK